MKLARPKFRSARRRLWTPRPRALWRRYVTALAIITLVITSSHSLTRGILGAAAQYAELVNVSGRQVVLSQRIMHYVGSLTIDGDVEMENSLKTSIRLFEDSHRWLINHPDLSDQVRAHYFDNGDIPLDRFSRQFAALARQLLTSAGPERAAIQSQIAAWGEEPLIASLYDAARLIKADEEENVQMLVQVQNVTFAVALLVLCLEAVFIFIPAHRSVTRAVERLERRSNMLKRSLTDLKLRNRQLIVARQDLAYAANHDALTGLTNRRALLALLSDRVERQTKKGGILGLLKADLDDFKCVNDTYGHRAGDQVLATVARRLSEFFGPNDVVARIGGDEFVILIDNVDSVSALHERAEEMIKHLRAPIDTDGARCEIGASIGLTVSTAGSATRDQLLVEADLALYEAKRRGKYRVQVYSDDLQQKLASRSALFSEIRQALDEDQFEAWLQPQIDIATGQLYGCEVLARWNHPEQGILLPPVFIDAAREAGLLQRLDLAVTERALDGLEALRAAGIDLPRVSVNACAETLRDPRYVDQLMHFITERHLKPQDLVVEILESTLIENRNDAALRTVEQLTREKIGVWLDDFGTGYASMAMLSRLRLDGIKLDRSLIDPLPDERARSIVAALVALSQNLGMHIVAEGVEAPRHFNAVTDLRCDVMQGFGIGRPMHQDQFIEWYGDFTTLGQKAASG